MRKHSIQFASERSSLTPQCSRLATAAFDLPVLYLPSRHVSQSSTEHCWRFARASHHIRLSSHITQHDDTECIAEREPGDDLLPVHLTIRIAKGIQHWRDRARRPARPRLRGLEHLPGAEGQSHRERIDSDRSALHHDLPLHLARDALRAGDDSAEDAARIAMHGPPLSPASACSRTGSASRERCDRGTRSR